MPTTLADEWADDWWRRIQRRFRVERSLHGALERERRGVMLAVQAQQGDVELYDRETEYLRRKIHASSYPT